MTHPSVIDILAFAAGEATSPELEKHVAGCASCREIAGLGAPLVAPGGPREPAQESDEALEVPVVDRRFYTRWEEISDGRGGMGRAFRAWDRRLGRLVAIKELIEPSRLPDPAMRALLRRRFEREAQLTARLEHPSIVGVHEAGRWPDGEPFYAMRLVRGTPLDEEIQRRRTPGERLALIPNLQVVAEAVAYAHDQGILHRDLKPANVLLGQFGETVVIDWGLAKDLRAADGDGPAAASVYRSPRDGLTQMGFGTPQYMPPEQARGEDPSFAMDVYALGATLYHLLSGEPPYGHGEGSQIRARLLEGPPRPIAAVAPDAPANLQDLCEKAMARAPERRFQSALELADELRRFHTGQLTRTRRYTFGELLRHWARRHRAALRVAALALASLAVLGALGLRRIVEARNRAEASERLAERELQKARGQTASQLSPRAVRRIDAAALGVKAVGAALRAGEAPAPEALQGLVDALAAGPLLVPLHGHRGEVRDFDVSPDGATLVTAGSDRTVRLWDARSGRLRVTLAATLPYVDFVRVSPRGDHVVAWGTDQDAEVWDLRTERRLRLPGKDVVAGAAFTPDGLAVVIADAEAAVAWEVDTGRLVRRLALGRKASALSASAAASATGRFAVGLTDGTTVLWDPATGASARLTGRGAEIRHALLTPDGRRLVTADARGSFLLWDLAAEPPRAVVLQDDPTAPATLTAARDARHLALLTPRGTPIFDLLRPEARLRVHTGVAFTFSRDGGWLYGAADDGQLHAWDVEDGRERLRLDAPPDFGEALRAYTDAAGGERLAMSGTNGTAYLWDARAGLASGLLLGHSGEIVSARASSSGERLLTASTDGTARAWDLASGRASAVMRGPSELVDASFSTDERLVVTAGVDGRARVFDATGRELLSVGRSADPLSAAALSPDGRVILTASLDGTATLWDATTGGLRRTLDAAVDDAAADPAGAVTAAGFSPDGQRVVTGHANRSARVWDVPTGEVLATLPNDDPDDRGGVASVFFSPDGDHVLVGFGAGSSLLCGARDLAPVAELPGRSASATAAPFSPDGRRVVTVGGDGRVTVTDLEGGGAVLLEGHARLVLSAAFTPDGGRLVTAAIDGTLRVWDAASGATTLSIDSIGQGEATWARLSPDGRWLIAAYGSGALRLHPAAAQSAMARACEALAYFGRAAEVEGDCPAEASRGRTEKSRNSALER